MFQPIPVSQPAIPAPPAPPPTPGDVVVAADPATAPPPAASIGADGLPIGLLTEVTAEVDEAHKSILRRARRQLLKMIDEPLVTAYNTLVAGVNQGLPPDELVDLNDELEDAYSDARHAS